MPNSAPSQTSPVKSNSPVALIAGGAGFIGSHLVETLVAQNFQVVCVDNFSTGKKENLKEVLTAPNFTLIEADISDPKFTLPDALKVDYCFHLASVEDYLNRGLSLDTLLVNSLGTKQLLEIARAHKAKFILVSAADLYSGAISSSSLRYYFGKTPTEEAVLSTHEAKRFSEALAFEYYKKYKLDLTIVRLKDAYGPRMDLERGDELSNLLKQALAKDSLQVPGDGLKIINPTFVSDIIFGLIKASLGDFNGEIFILVNPDKVTLESFAQTIKLVAGPLEIEHQKDNEPLNFGTQHFDLENTKEKIAWKPKVALAEGVSSVIHQVKIEQEKTEQTNVVPETSEMAKPEEAKPAKSKSNYAKFSRLAVFFLALGLLLITLVYPAASFGLNSYLGKQRLEESYQLLLSEQSEAAVGRAFAAQTAFQEAESSLNNLSWLAKIIGWDQESATTSDALAAAAVLAEAVRSSSRGNQILIAASAETALTPEQAEARLQEALDNLYAANDRLSEAQALLSEESWQGVSSLLLPTQEFLITTSENLEQQIGELITTIEQNLAKITPSD